MNKVIVGLAVGFVIFLSIVGVLIYKNNAPQNNNKDNGQLPSDTAGIYQEVTIGIKNFNYDPQTITVKEGIPVRITLDNSVTGCYRTFVIREFGVSQYSKDPTQKIIFKPDKTGTFVFQCSMGMGTGKLVVV